MAATPVSSGSRVKETCEKVLETVKRTDKSPGFQGLPRRWVVERTFGWLGRYRRLAKDYECLPQSSQAMVQVAMIRLMLRRLARRHQAQPVPSLRLRGAVPLGLEAEAEPLAA
jgi:hypothetical protein